MELSPKDYVDKMKDSLSISDLIIGEKYSFITKNRVIYLGEFYNKNVEIESHCWHDGPEFIIKLEFEYDLLQEYNFYNLSDKGFISTELGDQKSMLSSDP